MRHGFAGVQGAPCSAPAPYRAMRLGISVASGLVLLIGRQLLGREPHVDPARLRRPYTSGIPGHRYRRGDFTYDLRRHPGRHACRNVNQPGVDLSVARQRDWMSRLTSFEPEFAALDTGANTDD